MSNLKWDLDVTDWDFNERRTFNFDIADATFWAENPAYNGVYTPAEVFHDVASVDLMFLNLQNSSGLFDNFRVVAIPEPTTLLLALLALVAAPLRVRCG